MAKGKTSRNQKENKITRYAYHHVREQRTQETGHTPLLPAEELVVTLPMDNGCRKAIVVGKLAEDDGRARGGLGPGRRLAALQDGKRDLREDRRWEFGVPPAGKANFAWVSQP